MKPTPRSPQSHLARAKSWIAAHRIWVLSGIGALVVAAAVLTTYIVLSTPVPAPTITPVATKPKPPAPKYYSPLNGIEMAQADDAKKPLTAIMIENSPDARPQSGLKQAEIVYEAIAEGGITRFLTIFQQHKPEIVGPVRSLRMYYLDWAAPYHAGIAHVGGSAAALAEVRNGNYYDLDQFFNGGSFWRASDRYAPHNVYTNFEKLDALNVRKGNTAANFSGLPRVDGKPVASPDARTITVNFSGPMYNTEYVYDPSSNTYARSIGGAASNDREGGQISPSVIVAMHVDMIRILEDGYRESITTSGSGSAEIFQNGTVIHATWHKSSRAEPLQFTAADGTPLSLVRGQTWIAAVPNGSGSVSWQ